VEDKKTLMMIVGQEGRRPRGWDGAWASKMIGNVAREGEKGKGTRMRKGKRCEEIDASKGG
jgi:hypothetical protein